MKRTIIVVLMALVLTTRPLAAEENTVVPMLLDGFETPSAWSVVGGGQIALNDVLVKDGDRALRWSAKINNMHNAICGIERTDLKLPLPEKLSFWVYPAKSAYLMVGLSDSQGNRVLQTPIPGLQVRQWNLVELTPKTMLPTLYDGKPLVDLDGIFIGTTESSDQYPTSGIYDYYLDALTTYTLPLTLSREELTKNQAMLDNKLAKIRSQLKTIDSLIAQCQFANIDITYPLVSRTVIERFIAFAATDANEAKIHFAHQQADFLLACAGRTIDELKNALIYPDHVIRAVKMPMQRLIFRDGIFYSGDRPVVLVSFDGRWDQPTLSSVTDNGFNCISMECGPGKTIGLSSAESTKNIQQVANTLDRAKVCNLAVKLQLSPHDFPEWVYKKYPNIDKNGERRTRNPYMPWNIDNADFRTLIDQHLSTLLPQIASRDTVACYNLVNGTGYEMLNDMDSQEYQQWIGKASLQKDYWNSLGDFNKARLTDFLNWYADEVHKYDAIHPASMKIIDANAAGLTANSNTTSFQGSDTGGRYALDIWQQSLQLDIYRSLRQNTPNISGEYQLPYDDTVDTSSEYIRTCMWNAVLHGGNILNLGVWEHNSSNTPAQCSLYSHPWCMEAAGRTALDLQRLMPYVAALSRQHAQVVLLNDGLDFQRVYKALFFLDAPVDIISDLQAPSDTLENYRLLVIPADAEINAKAQTLIQNFQAYGGRVFRCTSQGDEEVLSRTIDNIYGKVHISRPIRVGIFGVEMRSTTIGGIRYAYLVNYLNKSVTVHLKAARRVKLIRDRITERNLETGFPLEPMTPVLLEIR